MQKSDRFEASHSDAGRYRLLVEAITDYAIYMLDPDGMVSSWNPGARRFKGYAEEEILGQHFSRFYTPEDRAAGLPERALATAAGEGRFENEGWRLRKDGTRFWAHVVIDPIRGPEGSLVGFAKITRDLTERKKRDEAIRQGERQFALLVQGVTDYAIFMLDPAGLVSSWNAGAERIKGYRPEEIIGRHFSTFYTAADRERGEPARALDIAAREGRFEKEGQRVRKDGSPFWANVVIDAIRDEEGAIIGFAKITRDVTERKQAQRALDEAREALFQSQKMESIGQLTGGIAHDFNNLLMAVLSGLRLVRKRIPEDPRVTSLIENAIEAAQRGSALTQRMLAFARRQELKLLAVDLGALVGGMRELMQRSLGVAYPIELRFPHALPAVTADPHQLELALMNLMVNARDAMTKGGSIVVSARAETIDAAHAIRLPPGRYVCLSVADSGEGMDAATAARAMEPFFTTKGIGKGTGLGLSMVHGMAEQSRGRLTLDSTPGQGTTVSLWLPVAVSAPEPAVKEAAPSHAPACVLRVLVVDDDPLVLMGTAAMLEDLGHVVLQASSGREALDLLRGRSDIDLVLTDQAMPRMTGVELAEAIAAERPGLPVALATGYAELPAGPGRNLPRIDKPFTEAVLARTLAAIAGGRAG